MLVYATAADYYEHAENSLNKYEREHMREFSYTHTWQQTQIPIERNGWSKSHTSAKVYVFDQREHRSTRVLTLYLHVKHASSMRYAALSI